MSSLIVEVCRVDAVDAHPNADRMCICTVKGWRVCAGRDPETGTNAFAPGDLCVYIPPDSVLPVELSDRLGCTKYLSPLPVNADGVRPPGGRVRVTRLRSEPSYGLIMRPDDANLTAGTDVAAFYGITKFEPPPVTSDGEGEKEHPLLHRYTNIENYRNFPELIAEGEEVVFTEKLHGMNARLALVRTGEGEDDWTFMVGSHSTQRQEFDRKGRPCKFWEILTEPIRELLRHVARTTPNACGVVLFGELFGAGVQDMWYGMENGRFALRAFDIAVNSQYLGVDEKLELFRRFEVPHVPVLHRGRFSKQTLEEFVSGPTTMCPVDKAGKFKGREGIVITPVKERPVRHFGRNFDRVILKAISFEYLERKGGTEYH